MKLNRKYHIRRKGTGKGKVRKNPIKQSSVCECHVTINSKYSFIGHAKYDFGKMELVIRIPVDFENQEIVRKNAKHS